MKVLFWITISFFIIGSIVLMKNMILQDHLVYKRNCALGDYLYVSRWVVVSEILIAQLTNGIVSKQEAIVLPG